MSYSDGFVVWHRRVFESWLWTLPPPHFKVAFAVVGRANWRESSWHDGSQQIVIRRGELVTSVTGFAKFCKVSPKQVRVTFSKLEAANFIFRASGRASNYSHITVINYEAYQDLEHGVGKPEGERRASGGRAEGERRATNEQRNKGTKEQKKGEVGFSPSASPQGQFVIAGSEQAGAPPPVASRANGKPKAKPKPKPEAKPKPKLAGVSPEGDELAAQYIDWFNEKYSKRFSVRDQTRKDCAKLAHDYTLRDLQTVTVFKWREWNDDDEMAARIVPGTLLRKTNFDRYIDPANEDRENSK